MIGGVEGTNADVGTDRAFETKWNKAQLTIQSLMALFLLSGVLGLFGSGLLAQAVVQNGPGLALHYESLIRNTAPTEIEIDVQSPDGGDRVPVRLNRDYLDRISVARTEPRAVEVQAGPDGAAYIFDLGPERRGRITFSLTPHVFGLATANWLVIGQPVPFTQFVYP